MTETPARVVGVERDKIKAKGVSLFEARSGEFENRAGARM